jgi:TldD protein
MRDTLRSVAGSVRNWTELRVHDRRALSILVRRGEVQSASYRKNLGVGVRVLAGGTWGFSSTDRLDREGIERAVHDATLSAESSARGRTEKIEALAECELAVGDFRSGDAADVASHTTEEKTALVVDIERRTRESSSSIRSATCRYNEIVDEKWIVSSDGADAHIEDTKLEFAVSAVAGEGDDMQVGFRGVGVTGGWEDLFRRRSADEMSDDSARVAVDLLSAPYAPGGTATVVLNPELVGLLAHEAIGHTVEADFVLSGSAVSDRMGQKVASDLVTLVDSGPVVIGDSTAGGIVLVDDEGVPAQRTVIIDRGVLTSFLHDRETAARFGVAPTGNARAWQYDVEPLIRMRNTYIEPGETPNEELIADVGEGFLLKGAGSGQADANAEFMFGVQEAYEIKNGRVGRLLRGATISGDAFEVLRSVDAVSSDFEWAIGNGYCGKGQVAKVDGGGPYVRCRLLVGGR